jgi:HK97 gp10 family phage protein
MNIEIIDQINYGNIQQMVLNQVNPALEAIGAVLKSEADKNIRKNVRETASSDHYREELKSYGGLSGSLFWKVIGNAVIISTNKDYAAYVEFGTGKYVDPKTGYTGRQTPWTFEVLVGSEKVKIFTRGSYPHPFLRPALWDNQDRIKKIFASYMNKVRNI